MTERNSGNKGDAPPRRSAVRHVAVRYGRMKTVGEFTCPDNLKLTCGMKLVISTDRGIEIGEHVDATCQMSVPCQQMRAYAENSGSEAYRLNNGRVLRLATDTDLLELRHIEEGAREKVDTCNRFAGEFGLDMKIVDCEHLFGGERVVFYFMAAERVDFRELVRRLATEYQTRIEMRQIGARDEARLLADYETCGQECCCRNMLKALKPISMQMAKLQKATLDPAKVSGRCGRLKCCLRYEHETYETLVKRMPRLGSWIATDQIVGRVTERQVLTQLVKVADTEGRVSVVPVEEIVDRNVPPAERNGSRAAGRVRSASVAAKTDGSRRTNATETSTPDTESSDRPGQQTAPPGKTEPSAAGPPASRDEPPTEATSPEAIAKKGKRRGRPHRRKRGRGPRGPRS